MIKGLIKLFIREVEKLWINSYCFVLNVGYVLRIFSLLEIPIVINNFNRLTFPLKLISFLENCGFRNIIILDNNSTYKPLIKYYSTTRHKVIRLQENLGHLALWKSGLYDKIKYDYFVYTDPDVLPIEDCPLDFLNIFKKELSRRYHIQKIGFGIKIDDLPDYFSLKKEVIKYETAYWENKIEKNLYKASIDTTFALYKPFSNLINGHAYKIPAIRYGHPFLIRHLPWYLDEKTFSEEEKYYINSCNSSSSMSQHAKGEKIY